MNKIVYAGKARNFPEENPNKFLLVSVGENDGKITVIPPLCKDDATKVNAENLTVVIEKPLTGLKNAKIFDDVIGGGIAHAARQAEEFFNSDYDKKDVILTALGNLLISYICFATGAGNGYSPTVRLVVEDVENNVSVAAYSLEDALKKLPLSYDYVRKTFKKEVGITPHEYLVKCRMELAAIILTGGISNTYSSWSVSQVAEACGYSEPLYFSRVFKKYYGIAPSEYGKR